MISSPTETPIKTQDARAIANALRPVFIRIARELRRETEALGVTSRQVTLLWLVRSHPGLSLRELATEEGISAPALSDQIDRLETAGLLERVRSAADRRRVGLVLTPNGSQLLQRVRSRRTTWLAARLDAIEDEELEAIARALPALEKLLETGAR